MAKTIIYTGPFAAGVQIETGQWLEPNDPTEVDDAIAGKAPKGDNPGEGLLAQVDNFTEVTVKGRKAKGAESNG